MNKVSLLPLLFDLADDPLDDAFGYGLYPHQFRPALHRQSNVNAASLWPRIYPRSWLTGPRDGKASQDISIRKSNMGKDGFQVCMDVQHFKPNEITVKTVDNTLFIEAKHDEKEDEHGHISRHFVRRYELPKDIDVNEVVSMLSSDGVLTIKAPPKNKTIDSNERLIVIQQTGPAHLSVAPNVAEEETTKSEE